MDKIIEEVFFMTKKTNNEIGTEQVTKGIDSFWNSWLNGVEQLNQVQTQYEKESFLALETFQASLTPTSEQMKKAEENSEEFSNKMQEGFQPVFKQINQLYWDSHHTVYDFFKQSQSQFVANNGEAFQQHQDHRANIMNTIDGVVQQVKDTQKSVVNESLKFSTKS